MDFKGITVFDSPDYLKSFPPNRKMAGEVARGTDPLAMFRDQWRNLGTCSIPCVGSIAPNSFVLRNGCNGLSFLTAYPYELTECEKRGHLVKDATLEQVRPMNSLFRPVLFSGGVCSRCGKHIPPTPAY